MLLLGDLFSTDFIENASSQSIYLSAMQQTLHTVSFPQFSRISQFNSKGQLISQQIYAVLNFPKMQRNIARISALASKMGQSASSFLRYENKKIYP